MKYKRVYQRLACSASLSLLLLSFVTGAVLAAPAITLSTASGTVGSTLTISGTGFTVNTTGTVTFGSGSALATSYSATSDNTGAFSTSFFVPTVPGGAYTILATLGTSASASFTVTPAVILSTTSAHVGDLISISGNGFSASLRASIAYDGTTIINVTTNTNGSFDATFTVPHSVYGAHTVTASDGIFNTSTTLRVTQFITVSPAPGEVGSSVTVIGSGFSSSAAITVNLDGTRATSSTSDAYGDFSVNFTVPATTGGIHTIAASGGIVSASATFSVLSTMRLSASSGHVGASVTVSGSAFSSSTTITITLDDTYIMQATTDVNGSFSVSLAVPANPGGARTLTASDGTFSVSTTFTILSSIKINPVSGRVGSQTIVTGAGFGSGTFVGVSFDNTRLVTANADANGGFSASINIPPSAAGNHVISANDGTLTANSAFTIVASISVLPEDGPMGIQVTITGTGFAATGAITIQMGNTEVAKATADDKGSFSQEFLVPQLDAGNYNLTVTDGTNALSAPFFITASFRISPTDGHVGSNVTVSGTGFSDTVSVRYDDSAVATATVGANGAFSAVFTVPASIHGTHIVSVNDATNRLKSTFTMESSQPLVPALLQPQAGARQDTQPTLTWTPVTDPSGVIYTMQIATDASFTNLVLEKDVLTETQYKLVSAERLPIVSKNTPYYWRVKALDLAQNESNWSTPSSFYVSLLAPWATWTLIGQGALAAILLLVWLGGRRRRSNF
ncbi:beta strand repeat-containing protein [Chloroflexota bacterium]